MKLGSHLEIKAALDIGSVVAAKIPEDVYRSFAAMNYSQLKAFEKSPAKYAWELENPSASSKAQELGSAIHCAILEPEDFVNRYAMIPKFDRRTKDGKANAEKWEAENAGKTPLTEYDWKTCERLVRLIDNDEFFKKFFRGGIAESTFITQDKEFNIFLKGKIDYYIPDKNVIVDVKTCDSAHPSSFIWDIKKYGYANQMAFYFDLVHKATGKKPEAAIIIAVEKIKDCDMQAYYIGDEELEISRNRYRKWLHDFNECLATGEFRGYERKFIEFNTVKGYHA